MINIWTKRKRDRQRGRENEPHANTRAKPIINYFTIRTDATDAAARDRLKTQFMEDDLNNRCANYMYSMRYLRYDIIFCRLSCGKYIA